MMCPPSVLWLRMSGEKRQRGHSPAGWIGGYDCLTISLHLVDNWHNQMSMGIRAMPGGFMQDILILSGGM